MIILHSAQTRNCTAKHIYSNHFAKAVHNFMMGAEAQLGGAGARPPLAPERGGRAPPLQNEKKERMAKIRRKPIELL